MEPTSPIHRARLRLFARGYRQGHLTLDEIDAELPPSTLGPAERWLLLYSLQAIGIEIREAEKLQPLAESA